MLEIRINSDEEELKIFMYMKRIFQEYLIVMQKTNDAKIMIKIQS